MGLIVIVVQTLLWRRDDEGTKLEGDMVSDGSAYACVRACMSVNQSQVL